MRDFKGTTNSEDKMFKAIQRSIGAYDNGWIGCQTMSDLAIKVGADCFPVTLEIYGMPTIIAKDLELLDPNSSLSQHKNSMLGSFTYPRATTPCSILVNNGEVVFGASCHAYTNKKPESVLYRLKNGKFGIKRCMFASELPKDVKWAFGGMGLLNNYDPAAEGFTGIYGDVLRRTDHVVVGVKNNMVFGVYMKSVTGSQVNNLCRDKFKFEYAVMGDGGEGLTAMNGEEGFAKIRVNVKQGYIVKFI